MSLKAKEAITNVPCTQYGNGVLVILIQNQTFCDMRSTERTASVGARPFIVGVLVSMVAAWFVREESYENNQGKKRDNAKEDDRNKRRNEVVHRLGQSPSRLVCEGKFGLR